MTRRYSLEIWGSGIEILGLLVLLYAGLWQATISEFWTKTRTENAFQAQHYLLEEQFGAIADLGAQGAEHTQHMRDVYRNAIQRRRHDAQELVYKRTQDSQRRQDESGAWQQALRHVLFVVGAALVVAGKILVTMHKAKPKPEFRD